MDAAGARNPVIGMLEFDDIDERGGMDVGGLLALRNVLDGRIGEDTANGDDGGEVGDGISEVVRGGKGETIEEAEGGRSCGQ